MYLPRRFWPVLALCPLVVLSVGFADEPKSRIAITGLELAHFRETPFAKHPRGSAYHACRASLVRAETRTKLKGLELQTDSQQRCWLVARSVHTRVDKQSGGRLVCELTGYGTYKPDQVQDRFSFHSAQVVNFGIVPEDYDFKAAQAQWDEWRGNPTAWKRHVRNSMGPLYETLKLLGVRADVTEGTDFGGKPALIIHFDAWTTDRQDLMAMFPTFRGINVRHYQKIFDHSQDEVAEPETAPITEELLAAQASQLMRAAFSTPSPEEPALTPGLRATLELGERPTAADVDLARLGSGLKIEVQRLLEGTTNRWSAHYAVRVKVTSDEIATALSLRRSGIRNIYLANWSLERIAWLTKYPGIVSIFADPQAR